MDPIYIVLTIIMVIWIGIFVYMFHIDREVRRLKTKFDKLKKNGSK